MCVVSGNGNCSGINFANINIHMRHFVSRWDFSGRVSGKSAKQRKYYLANTHTLKLSTTRTHTDSKFFSLRALI